MRNFGTAQLSQIEVHTSQQVSQLEYDNSLSRSCSSSLCCVFSPRIFRGDSCSQFLAYLEFIFSFSLSTNYKDTSQISIVNTHDVPLNYSQQQQQQREMLFEYPTSSNKNTVKRSLFFGVNLTNLHISLRVLRTNIG